ncbi:MAG: efflux RND transporter periplasmic adaptor subunit [Gammaproteobacteria bacterium]|nr:efflux RND transporter periplasmic adaptor subunit [Gammaproteobacteria bacterium]
MRIAFALPLLFCCSLARAADVPPALSHIAAGGLVEPQGEERVVIPEFSGRLKKVYIEEGDTVQAGQILAEIENAEFEAAVAGTKAQLQLAEANLAKLKAGARPEERREAAANRAEAESLLTWAQAEFRRINPLVEKRQLPASALDTARHERDAAKARAQAARERLNLIQAGTRAEDLAIAAAQVAAAQAELGRAEALLNKTRIRSPIDGLVLKRDLREGETVVSLSPIPLARIGDLRKLYVRADVDELDIARVQTEQKVRITAEALPGQSFTGQVVRVSRRMGKRNSTSENPTEKLDAKILEALIALDGEPKLPVGLRVDVQITVN